MERFLSHLGYEVRKRDVDTVPRDCVWICTAPEAIDPSRLRPAPPPSVDR
jgi:hypothetical protein